ncbi:MAG: hypothetical protein KDA37_05360 [Planctomycetales bacterium]|nr:hypothetical protein [Planctomycetales bacterium]
MLLKQELDLPNFVAYGVPQVWEIAEEAAINANQNLTVDQSADLDFLETAAYHWRADWD